MKFGVHWTTCIYICVLIALISITSQATHSSDKNILQDLSTNENQVNKRTSSSSSMWFDVGVRHYNQDRHFHLPHSHHSHQHIIKRRWDMYNRLLRLYYKRKNPWLFMENKGYCYQAPCKKNKDCCTMNNICDKSARVCIDCWYGYPCKSNYDCCARYPVCDTILGEKHGRCSRA